jgi:hypothetical protein
MRVASSGENNYSYKHADPNDCNISKTHTFPNNNELLDDFPVEQILKNHYIHGNPNFLSLTLDELKLYNDKNHDYAAGGRTEGNFERVSSIIKLYPGFPADKPIGICIIYMLKQLDAVMYMLSNKHKAKVEGVDGRLKDIHVYVKIARCILKNEENEEKDKNNNDKP